MENTNLYVFGRGGDGQLGVGDLKDQFFPILNSAVSSRNLNIKGAMFRNYHRKHILHATV